MLRSFMGFFIMGAAVLGVCVHVRPAAAQPRPVRDSIARGSRGSKNP